ncbi:YqcI/YcgG family protein [Marinicrinis sediminis]|uniref:YqcI/YcgG family protein n=1 Tax=Marinicrinis sediminis TaxID=1652465 RepID=A0ABW5RE24_9BACL
MVRLFNRAQLKAQLTSLATWKQDAFSRFAQMLNDEEDLYPCIPGKQAFQQDTLRYAFARDPRKPEAAEDLACSLGQYNAVSRETGPYASLVVFFDTPEDLLHASQVTDYEHMFWSLLSRVHELDSAEWPADIPQDPQNHKWEFCYQQEPYFAFCATPAHEQRRSRASSHFLIAFQPRWVFEHINDSTKFGRNMKKLIRERLHEYDGIEAHPSLKWYGQADNHEWKQYFLREDESSPAKCPFAHLHPSSSTTK